MLPHALVFAVGAGLIGLLIGSFLNVVIYRLPIMMERRWQSECTASGDQEGVAKPAPQAFNLMVPRSACPRCGHQIRWYENIPILSYIALRGRCASCAAPISVRYPLVELAIGVLSACCAWRWGASWQTVAWCYFSATLVALALIDWDTTLLPDDLTLPLMWGGLAASSLSITEVPLQTSLWGAMVGYISLWLVYWTFKWVTGKEGMGYGDFKLFAALGAWFGWQALVPMIFMASAIGAVVGIGLKLQKNLREGLYVPFGPFLAMAGLTAMFVSPQKMLDLIYRALGM